jgi:hypothetical protein
MEAKHQEYERFIAPIEKEMMRAVWRITGNRSDAEDAFQAALLKISSPGKLVILYQAQACPTRHLRSEPSRKP